MYPFERFTERAKAVLSHAQEEAEATGHTYIGTEHLLLGLLRDDLSLGSITLHALGVELEPARAAIADLLGAVSGIDQPVAPTSRVKKVIELAFEEARRMGHHYVGTEHLMLGILIEGEGVAARVLLDRGVTLDGARAEVERQLVARGAEEAGSSVPPIQHFSAALPMTPPLRRLMRQASAAASQRGTRSMGLEHLLDAMVSSAGIEALARLLDVRRHAAAKEQAIASQEYEAAAGHRTAERQARQALDQAIAAWRQELEPPAEATP